INARENLRGTTALMWAAANRNAPALRLLLANGADATATSATTAPGRQPYLAQSARDRIREFYFATGAQGGGFVQNVEEDLAEAELEVNVTREELLQRLPEELVKDFEQERATQGDSQVNAAERKQWGGLTALHFAVREGDLDSVKTLVEAGADV